MKPLTAMQMNDVPTLIRQYAKKHMVPPELVAAIIYQESRGEVWAYRFEEDFYARYVEQKTRKTLLGYVPPEGATPTLISEKRARAASWGLMQIMGQTARENGFEERWLPSLYFPVNNLDVGCKLLRRLLDDYGQLPTYRAYRQALLRYNGGADLTYPDLVLGHITTGDYKKILGEVA